MKCDQCKNMTGEAASQEYPYPTIWCLEGHWDGIGYVVKDSYGICDDKDPWADCKDFKEKGSQE